MILPMVKLPDHKTKIVCTIGPASRSEEALSDLVRAGMSIARLNFSHGKPEEHERDIRLIRSLAERMNRIVPVMIDLPGPKIRVGRLSEEPLVLKKGEVVNLFAGEASSERTRIPVNYARLAESVSVGSIIYLNDGFIQLKVRAIHGNEINCLVAVGGTLLSRKGLNFPGSRLFVDAVTDRDLAIVDFGLEIGVNIFCVSFVNRSEDIIKVKEYVRRQGKIAHVIAKIERAEAVRNIDEILEVADGIMVARGDLGVEIPIEEVPAVQKRLIHKANLRSRPVITATQMLESMTENIRPTRAEVTDVANAILDGTDAVMLSEETAIGQFPADAVRMMSRIAHRIEKQRSDFRSPEAAQFLKQNIERRNITVEDAISINVIDAIRILKVRHILAPTHGGSTPRRISRFKPECWILSFCRDEGTRDFLFMSYGVFPFLHPDVHLSRQAVTTFLKDEGLAKKGDRIILIEMVMPGQLGGMDSMGIMTLA